MLTIVGGFGRCGTTMMMHMLAAGGVAVAGKPPAFELVEATWSPLNADWLASLDGKAVKILELHRSWRGQVPARVIWLDRDMREQARSQIKMMRLLEPTIPMKGGAVSVMTAGIRQDRRKAMRVLAGVPMLKMRFEEVLGDPHAAAVALAQWFPALDVPAAARVVRARDGRCAPGLDMEIELTAMADMEAAYAR